MKETELKLKVLKMLKKEYPSAWVYKVSDKFKSGIPDLLICSDGNLWAIELKTSHGKLEPIQVYTLDQINKAGGRATVCRSVDEVRAFMDNKSALKEGGEYDDDRVPAFDELA